MVLEFAREIFLGFSLVANAVMVFFLTRPARKPKKSESYEVINLLHDLTAGAALVKIERVAPADVFIRSSRG